jgi:hypothetical protein
MKRRVRKIVNFFAFNLLFFALYLNFIHKDNVATAAVSSDNNQANTAAFSGTVLVAESPEQYLQPKQTTAVQEIKPVADGKAEETKAPGQALKLSIN